MTRLSGNAISIGIFCKVNVHKHYCAEKVIAHKNRSLSEFESRWSAIINDEHDVCLKREKNNLIIYLLSWEWDTARSDTVAFSETLGSL